MVDGLPVCQALLTGSNLGSDRGEQAFEHRKRIDSVHLWCTFYVHSQVQLKDTDTDQRGISYVISTFTRLVPFLQMGQCTVHQRVGSQKSRITKDASGVQMKPRHEYFLLFEHTILTSFLCCYVPFIYSENVKV